MRLSRRLRVCLGACVRLRLLPKCLSVCLRGKKRLLIINLAQLESQLWTRKRKKKKGKKSAHEYSVGELCEDAIEMQQLVRERARRASRAYTCCSCTIT